MNGKALPPPLTHAHNVWQVKDEGRDPSVRGFGGRQLQRSFAGISEGPFLVIRQWLP